MSPRDLAFEALDTINVDTIAVAKTRQLQRIARDITATMQQIYQLAPTLYKTRIGALIAAPETVVVTVTRGSVSFACSTDLVDGSTILVGNDPTYNEIAVGSGSSKMLRLPNNGLSGTYSATVWNDAIALANIDRVTGGVRLNEQYELVKRDNREDMLLGRYPEPDYGRILRVYASTRTAGRPVAYWVEPSLTTASAAAQSSQLRMRLYPLPDRTYTLGADVRVRAPRITAADLGTDADDSIVSLVVGADMIESVVRPLFLQRWAGSPWFRNKDAKAQIDADAKVALQLVAQYRAQQQSNRRITAPI